MTFSDTAMMELGITQSTNIHNTRSLIRTLKYVLDILQTEEASTVEEYKHTQTYNTHTHTHTHTHTYTHTHTHTLVTSTEAYSEPSQKFETDFFTKKRYQLIAVNYFHKIFHLRCLIGF